MSKCLLINGLFLLLFEIEILMLFWFPGFLAPGFLAPLILCSKNSAGREAKNEPASALGKGGLVPIVGNIVPIVGNIVPRSVTRG